MRYLWGIIGALSVGYFGLANFLGGRIYFSEIFLIGGIICLFIFLKYKWIMSLGLIKKNLGVIKVILLFIVGSFILLEGAIIMFPKKSLEKADLVIVLGAGLRGTTPSLTLKHRLDTTIKYIENTNYAGKIIVSGGQGPGEDITEAEAMKAYLMNEGIDESRIIKEDKSTSTSENLIYSEEVIRNKLNHEVSNELNVTIITTDFHAMRSNMLAKRNGYSNIELYTSNTEWYLIPNMYVREFFAFAKSFVFD
ncbi:YdcF family protein [uncultured Clostridium sp.]|uniref:YdcF family protein n=1 Tax=uncultured Clostridium sp. TaxID=59620 RepID=UPI002627367A|nr:YdcF family protein [uncultured Clostridium sp.]